MKFKKKQNYFIGIFTAGWWHYKGKQGYDCHKSQGDNYLWSGNVEGKCDGKRIPSEIRRYYWCSISCFFLTVHFCFINLAVCFTIKTNPTTLVSIQKCYPSRTEKVPKWKNMWISNKSWVSVNSNIPTIMSQFWRLYYTNVKC